VSKNHLPFSNCRFPKVRSCPWNSAAYISPLDGHSVVNVRGHNFPVVLITKFWAFQANISEKISRQNTTIPLFSLLDSGIFAHFYLICINLR